jgi:1-deoxy-D-xylulose-5-phosphate synthase
MTVLSQITSPADLKKLPAVTLDTLAQEIRRFLIAKVSEAGGHLGSNLGVVELTIAVHRVFNSPCDVLLFDTGHQAYVHKILTGRCAEFSSLRQAGGLSGYSSRTESVHDVIENSHASTALSYADGLAKAFTLHGSTDRRVVAIVGDGALTGGMCWEALNNLGAGPERPVIIVLNDNGRSYSPTVGGVARHLAALPGAGQTLFENLGLTYLGPVDGHDIAEMESALRRAGELNHPVVVHCVTRKGMGYPAHRRRHRSQHRTAPIPGQTHLDLGIRRGDHRDRGPACRRGVRNGGNATTSRCTGCRSRWCWTEPGSPARTGPATTACGTRRSCRSCPGYVSPRPGTARGYANCSAKRSRSATALP